MLRLEAGVGVYARTEGKANRENHLMLLRTKASQRAAILVTKPQIQLWWAWPKQEIDRWNLETKHTI